MAVKYPGRPLRLGDRGQAIRSVQRALNTWGGIQLAVDGEYGPATASKVDRWQHRRGIGSDGTVDKVMWHFIHRMPAPRLHPHKPETVKDKIRRLRVESMDRRRQRKRLKPGRRKRAVIRRHRIVNRALQRLVRRQKAKESRPRYAGGNKVVGGKPGERLVFAAKLTLRRYNRGLRPSFYSQPGLFTTLYAITGEPRGFRSDCSQWATSLFRACGLPDPNGLGWTGGYTGTLANHGRRVSRAEAMRIVAGGDHPVLVIWDAYGRQGHVEVLVSPQGDTIGHGSAPIAAHKVDDFAYKPSGPYFYVYE